MVTRFVDWAERHKRIRFTLSAVPLIVLAFWAVDRRPPFALTGPVVAMAGGPGSKVFFDVPVRRDLGRKCSATYTRYIIDSKNVRFDFADKERAITPAGIETFARKMGPRLLLAVDIPHGVSPGNAVYGTDLQYRCNPLHTLFPIQVHLEMPFKVSP